MPMRASFLRGQFSLRLLLLSMAVIGIAITIFRRPWEVKTPVPNSQDYLVTTYHRSWNGQPVKHGWEKQHHPTGGVCDAVCYDEGEVVCKRHYYPADELFREVRIDPKSGRSVTEQKVELVEYLQHEPVKKIIHAKGNNVVREEWRTANGQLLESTDWEDGFITHWNGIPIKEAVEQLLAEVPINSTDRKAWNFTNSEKLQPCSENLGDGRIRHGWFAHDVDLKDRSPQTEPVHSVVIQFAARTPEKGADGQSDNPDRFAAAFTMFGLHVGFDQLKPPVPFLHFLLTDALRNDCTLRWRHGVMCFIPISSRQLPDDRSGIALVKFPSGSAQDADWNEPITLRQTGEQTCDQRALSIFACTSIDADASRVADKQRGGMFLGRFPTPTKHSRRDLFGMFLAYNNFRVEQQGSKLIVIPRGDEVPRRRDYEEF